MSGTVVMVVGIHNRSGYTIQDFHEEKVYFWSYGVASWWKIEHGLYELYASECPNPWLVQTI